MHVQFIFRNKSPGYYVISKDDLLLAGPFVTRALATKAMRRILVIRKLCAFLASIGLGIFAPLFLAPSSSIVARISISALAVTLFWLIFHHVEDRIDAHDN